MLATASAYFLAPEETEDAEDAKDWAERADHRVGPPGQSARAVPAHPARGGRHGLQRGAAWKAEAVVPAFRKAQDAARDRVYFDPAVRLDGPGALGQFVETFNVP